MAFVSNNETDLAVLAGSIAVGGVFNGALVQLVKNDIVPDRSKVRGDYIDADYSGEVQKLITWGVPSIADDGTPEVIGTVAEFRPTGSTVTNTVFIALIVSAANALLAAGRLPQPVPMAGVNDVLVLTIRLRLTVGGFVVSIS